MDEDKGITFQEVEVQIRPKGDSWVSMQECTLCWALVANGSAARQHQEWHRQLNEVLKGLTLLTAGE